MSQVYCRWCSRYSDSDQWRDGLHCPLCDVKTKPLHLSIEDHRDPGERFEKIRHKAKYNASSYVQP